MGNKGVTLSSIFAEVGREWNRSPVSKGVSQLVGQPVSLSTVSKLGFLMYEETPRLAQAQQQKQINYFCGEQGQSG